MGAKVKTAKVSMKAARAMPGKRTAARGGAKLGARAAKRNAYLLEVLQNHRLQERIRTGIGSARSAYRRVSRRGRGTTDLITDPKARRDIGRSVAAFQEAAAILRGARVRRRRRIRARVILALVAIGGAGAVVLKPDLRQKVTGLLSGSSSG